MRRILVGISTALAVWFGSTLVAEAQSPTITPTGPLSVTAGSSSTTYTATITYPTSMGFAVKLWVYKNGNQIHSSTTSIPDPGTTTYYFSKNVDLSNCVPAAGDTLLFKAQLLYNRNTYNAADWTVIVSSTRPTSKVTSVGQTSKLALQSVERDRRKE